MNTADTSVNIYERLATALEALPGAKQTGRSLKPAALTAVSETPVAEPDLPARQSLVRKASVSSPLSQPAKAPACNRR